MKNYKCATKCLLPTLALLLLCTHPVQAAGDREEARETFRGARELSPQEILDRLEKAQKSGETQKVAHLLVQLGRTYRNRAQFKKAMDQLERARELSLKIKSRQTEAAALTVMGLVYRDMGQYEKALEYHQRALAIKGGINDPKIGDDFLSMGITYRFLGQYPRALECYEKAIAAYRAINARGGEASALNETGLVHTDMGQPEKALKYHEQALAIHREIKNRMQEQWVLQYMGAAYRNLGQYPKAIQYYNDALTISRELQNPRAEGIQLLSLGITYRRMGEFRKAEEYLNQSMEMFKRLGVTEFIWRAAFNLGVVYAKLGKFDKAIASYEESLDSIESLRSALGEDESKASFMQNKLPVYDRFIELLQSLHKKEPQRGYDRRSLEIFERKQGRVFLEAMGKSGAKQFAWLPVELRSKEEEAEDQLTANLRSLAEEQSKPEKERLPAQIQAFMEGIRQARVAMKALEEEIRAKFPDYHALKYPKPATVDELQHKVLRPGELLLVYNVMEKSIALWILNREHFELFTIPVQESELALKIEDFRGGVKALLDAVRKKQPEILIKRVLQESMQRMETSGRDLFDLLIPKGAQAIITNSKTLYFVPTGNLYVLPFEALISPQTGGGGKYHFLVEDHPVAYLSSASLLKTLRETTAKRHEAPRYPLLAFANPVYRSTGKSKSGSVQATTRVRDSTPPDVSSSGMSVRSMAYMDFMGGSFAELPETEQEVKEIGAVLGAPKESHPFQLRDAASRSNILQMNETDKLKDYRYLVFSCHGLLPQETDNLLQPALVLCHPDPQTKGDGFLTMADVFRLRLNAEFVSLAACNTGMGAIVQGEGIIGLTRAFMYAGTPALMVNLWSVESQSERLLNTGFYKHLKSGMSRAEALRQSKLELIRGQKDSHLGHPFFWSPSIIFGDGS